MLISLTFLVSKNIIDLHEGSISVYSAGMGHGCTFSIELPIIVNTINVYNNYNNTSSKVDSCNNDMNMNESELSPSPLVRLNSNLSNNSIIVYSESEHVNAKIKALVVDDSSMNRKMVRRLLEMKGNDADDSEDDDNNGYYVDDDHMIMRMMMIIMAIIMMMIVM